MEAAESFPIHTMTGNTQPWEPDAGEIARRGRERNARSRAALEAEVRELLARQQAEEEERQRALEEARESFTGACAVCLDTGYELHWDSSEWVPLGYPFLCKTPGCAAARSKDDLHMAEAESSNREYLEKALSQHGVPPRYVRKSFETFPAPKAPYVSLLRTFAEEWDGSQGLILKGPCGTGKTGLVVSALRAILWPEIHCSELDPEPTHHLFDVPSSNTSLLFTTTPDLLDRLRAGYDDKSYKRVMREAQETALLVLDDLGSERFNDWAGERLFAIVDHRYVHELPTFVTSNFGLAQLAERTSERLVDRLREGALILDVDGPTLRTHTTVPKRRATNA